MKNRIPPSRRPGREIPAPDGGGQLDRLHLIDFNIEKIEMCYLGAVKAGVPNSAVLVMDLRDHFAGTIARGIIGDAEVDRFLEESRAKDIIPTHIIASAQDYVAKAMAGVSPRGEQLLRKPAPSGSFYVIAVAGGSNLYATRPIPEH